MPASTRRRLVAVITTLASTAVLLASPLAASSASAATSPQPVSFSKSKLTPGNDLGNPLRGQYRWMGYESQISGWSTPDAYYRDQVYWGRLERTKGVYDFSYIETGLKAAAAKKGKFGFRVMAYCPGCWMEYREDKVSFPPVTPTYLPTQTGTGTLFDPDGTGPKAGWTMSTVPDWNNEAFLSAWERLMAELGKRYANDPRLGYVDVGGYGKYGEWWVDKGGVKMTNPNRLRMVAAVAKAFPAKHVLLNTMTDIDFTVAALKANPNLGIRTDSVGCPGMYSMVTDAVDTRLRDVWKTRPFFAEWGTMGDPVAGRDQVKKYHVSTLSSHNMRLTYDAMTSTQKSAYADAMRSSGYRYYVSKVSISKLLRGKSASVTTTISNVGVAPTYDPWSVQLWLVNSSGQKVYAKALSVELRKYLPGTYTKTTSFTVPTTLPKGTYTATIVVLDKQKYSSPMFLADYGRRADGSYTLGTVVTG